MTRNVSNMTRQLIDCFFHDRYRHVAIAESMALLLHAATHNHVFGGGAAFNNALGKLSLHLKGRLHARKGRLGKSWTGCGEGVDLVRPLICYGLEPCIPTGIGADVATEEAVARHNVFGVNEAPKDGLGCLHAAWGGDEDAFPGVQVVALDFAFFQKGKELFQFLELPTGIAIICKPDVQEILELRPYASFKWSNGSRVLAVTAAARKALKSIGCVTDDRQTHSATRTCLTNTTRDAEPF